MNIADVLDYYYINHALVHLACPERVLHANKPLERILGNYKPESLTQVEINKYIVRRSKSTSTGTQRRELLVLVSAMNYAHANRMIAGAPKIHLPPAPPPKDRWLSPNEAEDLLTAASYFSRTWLFTKIALRTGARAGAIETLTWFQVDLDRALINFNPQGRIQTNKKRPIVPIADDLLEELRLIKQRNEWVLGHSGSNRRGFEGAVRRAGLEGVTRHTLRHTWATWAVMAGVPLYDVAAILGDTIETVTRVYAHHAPDYLRDAINFIPPLK